MSRQSFHNRNDRLASIDEILTSVETLDRLGERERKLAESLRFPSPKFESRLMSSIPPAVSAALTVQQQSTAAKINVAVMAKQLDAQQQAGDAINQILESTVEASKQIAQGHLDVKA